MFFPHVFPLNSWGTWESHPLQETSVGLMILGAGSEVAKQLGVPLDPIWSCSKMFPIFQYYMLEHDHMINIEKKINQMFDPMFEMVMFYWYKDIETISNLHWVVIGHNWFHLHPIFPLGTQRTLRPPRVPSVVWTPSTGTSQLYRFQRLHPAAPGHVLRSSGFLLGHGPNTWIILSQLEIRALNSIICCCEQQ